MGVPLPAGRRQLLTLALLGAPLLGLESAGATEIGVVDYQVVFDRFEATDDAQRTLDRALSDWDKEAKEMRDAIDALQEEIDSQKLMLSEERLREKQDELRRSKSDYERFVESVWGVNGKAAQRNAELTKPIAEKIQDVVARIGDERNLDVILDAGTGGVVWAKSDINITQIVLDDLALGIGQASDSEDTPETSPEEE